MSICYTKNNLFKFDHNELFEITATSVGQILKMLYFGYILLKTHLKGSKITLNSSLVGLIASEISPKLKLSLNTIKIHNF